MSKGFLIYAENSNGIDYVKQAYALALSIKFSQPSINSVSLVTNDTVEEKYSGLFDNIIEIPWYEASSSRFSSEHRWKLYHVTPYDETIVLDSDMLVLEDITTWWDYLANHDLKFCNRIKNYKLETVVDTVNRKTFIANSLTNPYFALHYFKKSDRAHEFYKTLEFVCKNWEWSWTKFAPEEYQNWCSMDLATAITIEMLLAQDAVLDNLSPFEFIHMRTNLQGWEDTTSNWTRIANHIFNSKGDFLINNIKQSKIIHYIEKDFCNNDIIDRLESLTNGT